MGLEQNETTTGTCLSVQHYRFETLDIFKYQGVTNGKTGKEREKTEKKES